MGDLDKFRFLSQNKTKPQSIFQDETQAETFLLNCFPGRAGHGGGRGSGGDGGGQDGGGGGKVAAAAGRHRGCPVVDPAGVAAMVVVSDLLMLGLQHCIRPPSRKSNISTGRLDRNRM